MINEQRVVETFQSLVSVGSESKNEGKFQAYLKGIFEELGLEVIEDNAKAITGYGANNLYCRLEGNVKADTIFFSSHMDTVSPGMGIKPMIKNGNICSDETTILGADDKAGIAMMIEMVQCLKENKLNHGTVEFVITVGEETGLIGAKAFDFSLLKAQYGYVLDSNGPVGGVIVGSPTHYYLTVNIKGMTAHAGVEPEKGLSALAVAVKAMAKMKLGRIDSETTANIGTINGGTANNVVMEHLEIKAEARSISKEKCEAQIKHMIDLFQSAADSMGAEISFEQEKMYESYSFKEEDNIVQLASKAIKNIGREPRIEVSGGGSDANIFNEHKRITANVSVGYEKIHTVNEYMPIEELKKGSELVLEIVRLVSQ